MNNDNVNHPAHYTKGGVECIDAIRAATGELFDGYLIGNVIKYCWRYRDKGGVEDLQKARWYLSRLIVDKKMEKAVVDGVVEWGDANGGQVKRADDGAD